MPRNAERSLPQDVVVSALVAIPLGTFGVALLFSDVSYGPAEMLGWLVIHFFVPGVLVGLLVPKRWFLSILVASPAFALVALGMVGRMVVDWTTPVVQVVVTEGSLAVSPTEFRPGFRLIIRNQGSDVHELRFAPIDEHADLAAVAANPPLGFTTRPLPAGQTVKSSLSFSAGSHVFVCVRAGHAFRGEIAKVRLR